MYRRWHEIFDLATPQEAIKRLESYADRCGVISTKKGVVVDFREARKRRKARTKLLRLREAWEYLFGSLPLASVRAKILSEWTVQGVQSSTTRRAA